MIAKVVLLTTLCAVVFAQHYGDGYGQEEHYPPQPYEFGYETHDDYGTRTYRKEAGDGHGRVQGTYGYKDDKGIERHVQYVADEHGYRADIKTNEPGTDNQDPADVHVEANPVVVDEPPRHHGGGGYGGGGYGGGARRGGGAGYGGGAGAGYGGGAAAGYGGGAAGAGHGGDAGAGYGGGAGAGYGGGAGAGYGGDAGAGHGGDAGAGYGGGAGAGYGGGARAGHGGGGARREGGVRRGGGGGGSRLSPGIRGVLQGASVSVPVIGSYSDPRPLFATPAKPRYAIGAYAML